ncbi:MocR-like pyridoxine biosynthesis transcription factor PdxR [Paenibacillus silvisoli]|uniref:MocR-like pyridoxine biosynthesis transcription factor PdxR n=1 Tax=Paenibacillus silvisoli TaxID=3110539 RepID=UPI0028049B14|nr:PLP-dependent aminotransferase family protein [Paenibacillus silvisoli]
MDLALDLAGTEPLYLQVYSQIRALILTGAIREGTKLPSIRSLMQQLSISKTTVETAYHMLIEEGYVISKERSGLIVASSTFSVSEGMTGHSVQREARQVSKERSIPFSSDDPIDFSLLNVDGDSFPFRIWRSIVNESLSLHAQSIHQYGDVRGEYELRESLTHYLRKSRGVVCEPEQIIIGSGIASSIQLLARLLDGYGSIAVELPSIAQVGDMFAQHRFQLVPVTMDDSGRLKQELEQHRVRLLYVTPSHRPTGDPLPYACRQQLLQWAKEHNGYIIEDDYDGELRLFGRPVPALQGLDAHGSVIYIGTFSKVFTPAMRMNYMVLPPSLVQQLPELRHAMSCPSRIDQWAMQLLISRGHWYRHLRRIRKIYRKKQQRLLQLLRMHFPDSVHAEGSKAGLHIELSIKAAGLNADRLIELASQEGVLVYGSQHTDVRAASGHPKIYLGFGGMTEKNMERGVLKLRSAWSAVCTGP